MRFLLGVLSFFCSLRLVCFLFLSISTSWFILFSFFCGHGIFLLSEWESASLSFLAHFFQHHITTRNLHKIFEYIIESRSDPSSLSCLVISFAVNEDGVAQQSLQRDSTKVNALPDGRSGHNRQSVFHRLIGRRSSCTSCAKTATKVASLYNSTKTEKNVRGTLRRASHQRNKHDIHHLSAVTRRFITSPATARARVYPDEQCVKTRHWHFKGLKECTYS